MEDTNASLLLTPLQDTEPSLPDADVEKFLEFLDVFQQIEIYVSPVVESSRTLRVSNTTIERNRTGACTPWITLHGNRRN